MIEGYKAFRENLVNQSNEKLEVGKLYKVEGPLVWNKNGIHFCTSPEDTLGFFAKYDDETILTKVKCDSEYQMHDNDYYGLYDMVVARSIIIEKIYSRKEMIDLMIRRGEFAVESLIKYCKLLEEEIELLKGMSYRTNQALEYYQLGNKDAYSGKLIYTCSNIKEK